MYYEDYDDARADERMMFREMFLDDAENELINRLGLTDEQLEDYEPFEDEVDDILDTWMLLDQERIETCFGAYL